MQYTCFFSIAHFCFIAQPFCVLQKVIPCTQDTEHRHGKHFFTFYFVTVYFLFFILFTYIYIYIFKNFFILFLFIFSFFTFFVFFLVAFFFTFFLWWCFLPSSLWVVVLSPSSSRVVVLSSLFPFGWCYSYRRSFQQHCCRPLSLSPLGGAAFFSLRVLPTSRLSPCGWCFLPPCFFEVVLSHPLLRFLWCFCLPSPLNF